MAAIESPPSPLPRWDVSDVFPSLHSRQLASAREQLERRHRPAGQPVRRARRGRGRLSRPVARGGGCRRGGDHRDQRRGAPVRAAEGLRGQLRHHRQPQRRRPGPVLDARARSGHAAPAGRPPRRVGGRPRSRGPGRRQPARRRPRVPPPAGGRPRRAPDARRRRGALRRTGGDGLVGVGPAPPGRDLAAGRAGHVPRRSRRDPADDRGAGPGHQRRSGTAPGGVRRRDRHLAVGGHGLRGGPQRHQGRGRRGQRPPRLG